MSERTVLPIMLRASERVRSVSQDTWGSVDGQMMWPVEVEIQPTAHCHRTCSFCSHIVRNRRGGDLTLDDMQRLLVELEIMQVKRIAFSGGGEPLFWKLGVVTDVIQAASRFAETVLTSSGDQLWDDERDALHMDAEIILRSCTFLQMNVPAVDEVSFKQQISGPSSWGRTRKIIAGLVELKRDRPELKCELYAVVVISRFNVEQLPRIDAELMGLGLDGIYYKQLKNFEDRPLAKVRLEEEALLRKIKELQFEKQSMDLIKFSEQLAAYNEKTTHCWVNRIGFDAIVDPNGDIYLCTPTVGKPEFSIGNLDEGFRACWQSKARDEVLRRLSAMSMGGSCPLECRNHADNRAIDQMLQRVDYSMPSSMSSV